MQLGTSITWLGGHPTGNLIYFNTCEEIGGTVTPLMSQSAFPKASPLVCHIHTPIKSALLS